MRISDWSSDVCSSDLPAARPFTCLPGHAAEGRAIREPRVVAAMGFHGVLGGAASVHATWCNTFREMLHGAPWTAPLGRDSEIRCNRSEEHTSELQSLMRTSYAVFCLKKKTRHNPINS